MRNSVFQQSQHDRIDNRETLSLPPSPAQAHLEAIQEIANAALYQRGSLGQPERALESQLASRTSRLCRDLGLTLPGTRPSSEDELQAAFLKGIIELASQPWDALHPDKISALALGLVVLGIRSRSLIGSLASLAVNQPERLTPQGIANLAWSCEIAKITDSHIFASIGDAAVPRIKDFEPHEVAFTVSAFIKRGMRHEDLFSEAGYHVATELPSFPTERMTSLMNSLNDGESWEPTLFHRLPSEIITRLEELTDHQVASIIRVFRKRGVREPELFNLLGDNIIDRCERGAKFSPSETVMLLEAYADFGITKPAFYESLGNRAVVLKERNRLGKHLIATAAWSLAIGHPSLIGNLCDMRTVEHTRCARAKLRLYQALLISGLAQPEDPIPSGLTPRLSSRKSMLTPFESKVARWLFECGILAANEISVAQSIAGLSIPILASRNEKTVIIECRGKEWHNHSALKDPFPRGEDLVNRKLLSLLDYPAVRIDEADFSESSPLELDLRLGVYQQLNNLLGKRE